MCRGRIANMINHRSMVRAITELTVYNPLTLTRHFNRERERPSALSAGLGNAHLCMPFQKGDNLAGHIDAGRLFHPFEAR